MSLIFYLIQESLSSSSTFFSLARFLSQMPLNPESTDRMMKAVEIGRVIKMVKEPRDMVSDCMKEVSIKLASTVASTRGATGKLSFRIT